MDSAAYSKLFYQALRQAPLRHSLRVIAHKVKQCLHAQKNQAPEQTVPLKKLLKQPSYHYQGYAGPWLEEYFDSFYARQHTESSSSLIYLPVYWSNFYQHAQTQRLLPAEFAAIQRELRRVLYKQIDPALNYFTVLQYDHGIWDWNAFPENIVVFSGGGVGDVAVPLLKGDRPLHSGEKDILVSFMGNLSAASDRGQLRSRMHSVLKDFAHFGQGANWQEVMARSTFTLCPRGLGRASFRLYEALSMSSIPIYIWDDIEWLPYADKLDWSEFSVSINIRDIESLPGIIEAHSEEQIRSKQQRIHDLYDDYFRYDGVCKQVLRICDELSKQDISQYIASHRVS